MNIRKNENGNIEITATPNFLEELGLAEFGAYEDGCEDATNLVEAIIKAIARENLQSGGNGSRSKETTITVGLSTVAYLLEPMGLVYQIDKWKSEEDFATSTYVRSGTALLNHLWAFVQTLEPSERNPVRCSETNVRTKCGHGGSLINCFLN